MSWLLLGVLACSAGETVPLGERADSGSEGVDSAPVGGATGDTASGDTAAGGTAAGDTAAGDTAAGDTAAGDTAADLFDESVLRTYSLSFSQEDWWAQLEAEREAEHYIAADLEVDGVTYPDVGVRFRGNSSYNQVGDSPKKPFKIKLDAFVDDQELMGVETLNLNNAFRDPSFVREVLGYHILRDFIPAPRAGFVHLIINGEDWGVYVLVEPINKDFLRRHFADDEGRRYKAALAHGDESALTWLGVDGPWEEAYELKSDPTAADYEDLMRVTDVLNYADTASLERELDAIFNVDRALWMLALDNALPSLDSYIGTGWNYQLYEDAASGRLDVIPWDFNECFGGAVGLGPEEAAGLSPWYSDVLSARPLMDRLVRGTEAGDAYLAHLRTVRDRWLDWSVIGPLAAGYQDLIRDAVRADDKKLYTDDAFEQNLERSVEITLADGERYTVAGIRDTVEGRGRVLREDPDVGLEAPTIASVTSSVDASGDVLVSAAVGGELLAVELRWRVAGAFQREVMRDDGASGDGAAGDGVWGGRIPAQPAGSTIEYLVVAKGLAAGAHTDQAWRFYPEEGEQHPLRLTPD